MTIAKLLRNIKRVRICFCKLGEKQHGLYEYEENNEHCNKEVFFVDLSKQISPARVFLHELLHRAYPAKSEYAVMMLERRIWKRASQRERYLLYRTLFLRKWCGKIS